MGSDDIASPLARGRIKDHDLIEIGELVERSRQCRAAPEQITFYKSVGVAVQDAAAASPIVRAATGKDIGTKREL